MPLVLSATAKALLKTSVHHFATLWRIERQDGVVLRFTDHDVGLLFSYAGVEETYLPAGGVDGTAREKQAGVKDHNLETQGIITHDLISDEDLRAGKYREAKVVEILVDYRYPYAGSITENTYYITQTAYNEENWQAQVSGQPAWLRRENGDVLSHDCRHVLGQGICGQGVDLAALAVGPVAVTTVSQRRRVIIAVALTQASLYFKQGKITWTSGNNLGIVSDVYDHQAGGVLTLPLMTPYEIEVGDQFTITPGCDLSAGMCKNKFNNIVNFGGYPGLPGSDKIIGGLVP